MFYTYIIRSLQKPDQIYIGATSNLKQRITDHNKGKTTHMSKFIPWILECYIAFRDKNKAYEFEKYLKSHSGRSFANKRLHGRKLNG